MAYADPQSITFNTVAKSLPRVSSVENGSSYLFNDGTDVFKMDISHSYAKSRIRHLVKLGHQRAAADVYQPAVNTLSQMSAHLVVDVPVVGFTPIQQYYVFAALIDNLRASTETNILKVIGGES